MKKVRFETPNIAENFGMSDSECHSPRPFESQLRSNASEPCYEFARVLPYSNDPVQRFDTSNCSPYPCIDKTRFPKPTFQQQEPMKPSNDLDLSLLDASNHEPRRPAFNKTALKSFENRLGGMIANNDEQRKPVLSAINKNSNIPPNILVKDNSFFIRRDNLDKYHVGLDLQREFKGLNMGKENNPYLQKAEIMQKGLIHHQTSNPYQNELTPIKPIIKNSIPEPLSQTYVEPVSSIHCPCHHCVKPVENIPKSKHFQKEVHKGPCHEFPLAPKQMPSLSLPNNVGHNNYHCTHKPQACSHCYEPQMHQNHQSCACCNPPQNAVDKKTWAIEKFEKRKQSECMEVEKQTNISKEKREPTVADLFKIIKLQNEQLQLLQDKVDKFISASQQNTPTISCSHEHVANEELKMSIGVMTSFELVRTSTVINKEVIKQTNDNQIQCNRSQISIKEVVSKPANLNFLDGIMPVNNPPVEQKHAENGPDKTLNELSLYNVQVDNATTPNLSPEQTLYLDVRDYSGSEASSNEQSNVGWTYYNKVMTHVNGMLQDSEMPSSASAMFRNMRKQCVNMQIDKSNISVTTSKRVKFGDDPLGIHQPHLYATDTSLKMNQLAAKYLKNVPAPHRVAKPPPNKPAATDMSFATRNYMEKHKLLQGASSKPPQAGEIPRFLDITALKQQPKLL